jgi:acetyltransferase-like isoleucine patch superfamily enzyme
MDKIINILKFFANIFGFFAAFLFPLRLKNGVSLFYSLAYSNYYSRFFKSCGSNFFIRAPLHLMGPKYISIGDNFYSGYRLRLEAINCNDDENHSPILSIGNNVGFNYDCHVGCANKIIIGNNVLFASRIFITDHFHGNIDYVSLSTAPNCRPIYSKGPVIIEDNVWIGEGVTILPNVTIGKNSIIGANSVVTINVPENSVAAGVPAKIIRILTPQ